MIGPHYERLAEIEQKMTAKQMLEKMKNRPDNPLSRVVDKLKKQFAEYETAYSDPIMDYQISSLDRILSFDSKLGPILDALEKENLLLRKQLGVLEGQLSNTVGICEQILSENNELKLIVKGKNQDINKIIDTIAYNQSEEMTQTEEKNSLLIRENSILMTHLEEIKKQHQQYASSFLQHQEEISRLEGRNGDLKKQLTQCLSRQRELSRKITLLEQSSYQNSEQLYKLKQQNQSLTFEKNELKNQLILLKERGEDSSYQAIKLKVESQFEPILEEHRLLKKERMELLRESEKLRIQKQKIEDQVSLLERQNYKLKNDLEMTTSLLHEEKHKSTTFASNLAKIESKFGEAKEENNRLRADKETSHNYSLTREKRLLQEIDDLRRELENKQTEVEGRIRDITKSMQGLMEAKDQDIRSLRQQNLQLQRLVQRR